MGILRVFFGVDARWRVFFGDPYCDDLERILMLERVDTWHRWLDILPAGGVVRHVFFGQFTGGRGNMTSASRARRYCSESSRIVGERRTSKLSAARDATVSR